MNKVSVVFSFFFLFSFSPPGLRSTKSSCPRRKRRNYAQLSFLSPSLTILFLQNFFSSMQAGKTRRKKSFEFDSLPKRYRRAEKI
jgi:hypothetical protein